MDNPEPSSSIRPFKRTYVACSSCRAHKSKCIIKDKPPCSKCQREHRECTFDKKARGPKHRAPPKWTTPTMEEDVSDSVMLQDPPPDGGGDSSVFGIPPAVGFQGGTPGSNPSPNAAGHSLYDRVRTSVVTSSNDALGILSDAARLHHPQDIPTTSGPLSTGTSVQQAPPQTNPGVTPGGFNGLGFTITRLSQPEDPTLDLWDKCRFVRQGWFTAQEAVTYIDL